MPSQVWTAEASPGPGQQLPQAGGPRPAGGTWRAVRALGVKVLATVSVTIRVHTCYRLLPLLLPRTNHIVTACYRVCYHSRTHLLPPVTISVTMRVHTCYRLLPCLLPFAYTPVTACYHCCYHARITLLPPVTVSVTIRVHTCYRMLPFLVPFAYTHVTACYRVCYRSRTHLLPPVTACYRLLPLLLPCGPEPSAALDLNGMWASDVDLSKL